MLEFVSIIVSSILFAFGVRMLIFLHVAWKHNSESAQITHMSPAVSELKSLENHYESRVVTFNDSLVLHDYIKFSSSEKNKQLSNNKIGKETIQFGLDLSGRSDYHSHPVVSIIIATNNEEGVADGLLESLEILNYNPDRFEIIVVDDSIDSTRKILEQWTNRMKNLRIIRRTQRIGSKGGALNLAIESLRNDSSWVIVIDADTILPPDIIKDFVFFTNGCEGVWEAIQGYCIPYNNYIGFANWVSRGVEFRLAQRNMIEFVAKNKLRLPVQITGSLFMIKTSTLKEIGFSTDICEDWDLTLRLHLKAHAFKLWKSNILFHENLNASNQAPTSFSSYFKQRLRVSEGHTRGFINMIPKLILQKQPLKNKIEIFFTGFRYLQYSLILSVLLLDIIAVWLSRSNIFDIYSMISLSIQLLCVSTLILGNLLGFIICSRTRRYSLNFLMSKLTVEICTLPALILGSLLGIVRKKGNFYRTIRISGRKS